VLGCEGRSSGAFAAAYAAHRRRSLCLKTLGEEAKVEFDETLTKAQASKRIDELQEKNGRGTKS
jgi:hypothetical protein